MKDPVLLESLLNQLFLRMDASQSPWSVRIKVLIMVIPGIPSNLVSFDVAIDQMEKILRNFPKEEIPKISFCVIP